MLLDIIDRLISIDVSSQITHLSILNDEFAMRSLRLLDMKPCCRVNSPNLECHAHCLYILFKSSSLAYSSLMLPKLTGLARIMTIDMALQLKVSLTCSND